MTRTAVLATVAGALAVGTLALAATLVLQTASAAPSASGDPDELSVWDDQYPGVANLDPALLQALRDAATDAADDGIRFNINSGWRSTDDQQRLLDEAVAEYGSLEAASRWVATPSTSAHVSGDAVDVGPTDATSWLSQHGAAYGLCQIYGNEPWHYELRPDAVAAGCAQPYADPTHDPRMG
jgi:LAS superfamily LD-carboxypeptidase LdcB